MHSFDDEDLDVFNTFSESLPVLVCCLLAALTVGVACSCGLTIAKAALSPFARIARWRPTGSSARSSDGSFLLVFGSQHASGEIRKRAAFGGEAEEPALIRRAA
jgi:hypothetical protein